jgi:hypothetical protein|tara:strand:- start:1431 stop:1697 length:267 start_codon:yes stop_codon:yes gene_type:complete
MILIEGIEDAIVGWANLGKHRIVVYSIDRLSNLIFEDLENGVTVDDVDQIVKYLEDQAVSTAVDMNIPPPVFVRSGDLADVEREALGG